MTPSGGQPRAGDLGAVGPASRRVLLPALLIAWAIAAVAFGVWDLRIVQTVVAPESPWGLFVARWGEIPGLLTIMAALTVLGSRSLARASGLALLAAAPAFVGLRRTALNLDLVTTDDLADWSVRAPLLAASLAIGIASQAIAWRGVCDWAERDWAEPVRAFARTTVWMALITPVAFVGLVKPLWGRARPREIGPDALGFTAWFEPQGITGHVSFPSGHTAMGWMVLPLLLLVRRRSRPIRMAVAAATVVWGLLVAAGRVRIGAHYPSDVLFSTGVSLTAFLLLSFPGSSRASRQPAGQRR